MIFTGLPDFQAKQRGMGREHRWIFFFAAEAAACFGLHHANAFLRQTKKLHERLVHVVRALQRTPDRDAFGLIGPRDHPLRLDVELLLRARFVGAVDDQIRGRPDLIDIAFFNEKGFENIVAAPDDFLFGERVLDA